MKKNLAVSGLLMALLLSATSVAQVKKESSPFEKYRQSAVNELAFRKLQFQVESLRQSPQPTPLPNGIGVPRIIGERADGKLVIEVEVHGSALPQTLDARKYAMMEAVDISLTAFSFAFDTPDSGMLIDDFSVNGVRLDFRTLRSFLRRRKTRSQLTRT